jgi:hypothetical protein
MRWKKLPPLDVVKQRVIYNQETGVAISSYTNKPINYTVLISPYGRFLVSRLVWLLLYDSDPGDMLIDHINGKPTDNRPSNLRLVTFEQNAQNTRLYSNNTSGHKGVFPIKTGFQAKIGVGRKYIFLGNYPTEEEAIMAYQKAAATHHGQYRRTT